MTPRGDRRGLRPVGRVLTRRARALCALLVLVPVPFTTRVAAEDAGDDGPHRVHVEPVELREPVRTLRFSGTTRASRRAVLSFPVGGRLLDRIRSVGRRVREGEILAKLDPAQLESEVLSSDAALADAKVQWRRTRRESERIARLVSVGARRQQDLEDGRAAEDSARARVSVAQARLRHAEQMLDEAMLRAPFAGRVSELHLEVGEYAAPGAPVLALSGNGTLEVGFQVPERVVRALRLGSPVLVSFPMSDEPAAASQISSITYVGAGLGSLFPVVARLPTRPGLMPGMAADVAVETRGASSLLVPVGAVIDPTGGAPFVFRVRDGRAERVPIQVHGVAGQQVVVDGALRADDRVIVAGHAALLDGDAVRIEVPASPAER